MWTLGIIVLTENKDVFAFQLKTTSWVCLKVSGIRFIFHSAALLFILSKSLLGFFAEVWMSFKADNEDVLLAHSL